MKQTPNAFFFPKQIGRASFTIRYVLCLLVASLGSVLLTVGTSLEPGIASIAILLSSAGLLLFALFYMIRHIVLARVCDLGLHNAYAVLIFVPIINLVFLLVLLFAPQGQFQKHVGTN